jgi:hypothetical protein
MNDNDTDEFDLMLARDHWLPEVSTERVADACRQIGLDLAGDKSWADFATEVRRCLAATMKNRFHGPNRLAPLKVRNELERVANAAQSVSGELNRLSDEALAFLYRHSLRDWDESSGSETEATLGTPPQFKRLKRATAEMDSLSKFLQSAASAVEVPQGPWRRSESRELRIEQGVQLAPLFEAAFGLDAAANNYPSDAKDKEKTPFMEFFQQMVLLAFKERATADLSGVLKEACRQHRARADRRPP